MPMTMEVVRLKVTPGREEAYVAGRDAAVKGLRRMPGLLSATLARRGWMVGGRHPMALEGGGAGRGPPAPDRGAAGGSAGVGVGDRSGEIHDPCVDRAPHRGRPKARPGRRRDARIAYRPLTAPPTPTQRPSLVQSPGGAAEAAPPRSAVRPRQPPPRSAVRPRLPPRSAVPLDSDLNEMTSLAVATREVDRAALEELCRQLEDPTCRLALRFTGSRWTLSTPPRKHWSGW